MNRIAAVLATWFGCGLLPAGPGTAGSLGALAAAFALARGCEFERWHFALLALALTPLGVWAADRYAKALGAKDPARVVIDEVLGQWLTLAGAHTLAGWTPWLLAFALFRLFDIVKPFPVRRLESLPGGAGIIADDLGAGALAAIVLAILGWFNLY
jgi:phosphatidylglycerophosphatase A